MEEFENVTLEELAHIEKIERQKQQEWQHYWRNKPHQQDEQ